MPLKAAWGWEVALEGREKIPGLLRCAGTRGGHQAPEGSQSAQFAASWSTPFCPVPLDVRLGLCCGCAGVTDVHCSRAPQGPAACLHIEPRGLGIMTLDVEAEPF